MNIPDNQNKSSLPGVILPTGAGIINMRVTINMTCLWMGNTTIGLKASNNKWLNLFTRHEEDGANLVNTVISSTANASFDGASSPFTGTFMAFSGGIQEYDQWTKLYYPPSSNWMLRVQNLGVGNNAVLTGWALSFDYWFPNYSVL